MKILVTGGAGFIGSHLIRRLLAEGEDAVALDNLSYGLRENLPAEARFVQMDIQDDRLTDFCREEQFDAIVHLAGQTSVAVSVQDPVLDARENVLGGVRVMEAARKSGVKRMVFSSTAAVYGNVPEEVLPIREECPLAPLSGYGLSKITTEHYLALYHELYGLDYVVLRFSNVFGERQGDGGEGGVISIFTKSIATGKGITIFGDGGQTRDFIYAGDVARGILAALRTGACNTVYHLSTCTEISLNQLVEKLSVIAGRRLVPARQEARQGDIYRSVLDNRKAREALGWQPEMPLEEALRRTYGHFI